MLVLLLNQRIEFGSPPFTRQMGANCGAQKGAIKRRLIAMSSHKGEQNFSAQQKANR